MKITKNIMQEGLDKALEIFSGKILKIDNKVIINYIDDKEYIESAKNNPMNSVMINMGLFKDFEKEYPSFALVYEHDRTPLIQMLGMPLKISVSIDRAKEILKKEPSKNIKAFLQYMFLHELIHLHEDLLKEKYHECYDKISEKFKSEIAANEMFAETFTFKHTNHKLIDEITKKQYQGFSMRCKKQGLRNPFESTLKDRDVEEYIQYI